ncbi:hypothetical protein TNCV_1479301 [Trichonephila clavipes]|nr:hypothetical protein TNCV_1479301 [Trichonephila clavipes]
MRLDYNQVSDKIFVAQAFGTQKRGRPTQVDLDCVEKDLKTINVKNWKNHIKNRTEGNGILRKAKAHLWSVVPLRKNGIGKITNVNL